MLLYISLSIFVIYLLYIFIRFKCIPESVSDTFYLGTKYLFTFAMWAIAFTLLIPALDITPEPYKIIAFLIGAGLTFVGAAPYFKDDQEKYIHFGGALTFGFASQIWCALMFSPWILLDWILIIPFIKSKKRTFWIEVLCVINLLIVYLLL